MALTDVSHQLIAVLRETGTQDGELAAEHIRHLDARVVFHETSPELLNELNSLRDRYGPKGVRKVMDALDVIADHDCAVMAMAEPEEPNIGVAAARAYAKPFVWGEEPCVVCKSDLRLGIGEHRMSFSSAGTQCNCVERVANWVKGLFA